MVQYVRNKLLGSFNCVTPLKLDLVIFRLPCMDVRSYSCTFSAGGKGVLFSLCYSSTSCAVPYTLGYSQKVIMFNRAVPLLSAHVELSYC